MAGNGNYYARFERALRRGGTEQAGGRLKAEISISLTDLAGADPHKVEAEFELMGPGDVDRLLPGAIVRRFPAPGSSDAEETKLPFIEFSSADLPWRYTPKPASGEKLEPWLALVVGTPGSGGLSLRPDGTVEISVDVQNRHQLSEAAFWAHVHQVGAFERARLLSPADLTQDRQYIAALVPAFTPDGKSSWPNSANTSVILPCYDWWTFETGPKGDFPDLAAQLRRADLAELALRGGRPFGRADLRYEPRSGAPGITLPAAGALRVPLAAVPDPADSPPAPSIAVEVAALTTPINVPDGREVVTAPDYPAAFTATGFAADPSGWIGQLTGDPRLRGAAGLGAWTAIAWQEMIADAAAIRLGDTIIAAEMIRSLALGVAASRSMWRRRVPADPVKALVVLAPALGRLLADNGGTVLDAIGGTTPQLAGALFSSAARRATRPGPARATRAAPRANDLDQIIALAARCPDPVDPPDPFARLRPRRREDAHAAAKHAIYEATSDEAAAAEAVERLLASEHIDPARLAAVLEALRPGPDGRPDLDALRRALDRGDYPPLENSLDGWEERPDDHAPECRPVDVGALGKSVSAAIDPTIAVPPAARRVFAMLPGVTSMRPLEVEPELDIALWSFLSTASPDWMLPGIGDLAEHEVIGVETNPAFVRALLIGANWQTASELRWRNIPLVPRSSPLRRFWQRLPDSPPGSGPDTVYDMKPVRFWPPDAGLSDTRLSPTGGGSEAVVVFKTPLFRRYPSTAVYLYDARPSTSAPPDWTAPNPATPLTGVRHVEPTFTGTIGPDVTFFGFPVPAEALAYHWVVLEEPPAGYRFYSAFRSDLPGPLTDTHGGDYARNRFALPVRVLLGPLL